MIGVAITTCGRRAVFERTLAKWRRYLPEGSVCVVVDDASDTPLWGQDTVENGSLFRLVKHDVRLGVAMAKNAGIEALMDAGCDHLFLADDDVHPIVHGWERPYVDSPEPHLSFQWPSNMPASSRWQVTPADDTHFQIDFPRGVLLYLTREVVEKVGGMDPAYGIYGGEHVEFSRRIYDAGLTTWPYADVIGSDDLWFALDRVQNTRNSCLPLHERAMLAEAGGLKWGKPRGFMPYWKGASHRDEGLGPRLSEDMGGVLDHTLAMHPFGTAVEFGVGEGGSIRRIAKEMQVIGFDSFEGLPERWRDGFEKGTFACEEPTIMNGNARLVTGWFEDTVPGFDFGALGPIGLLHLDADLYSSTATALKYAGPYLRPGSYVVLDEYHGYEGCEQHEQRAWNEFIAESGLGFTVVGHGPEQFCVRIL